MYQPISLSATLELENQCKINVNTQFTGKYFTNEMLRWLSVCWQVLYTKEICFANSCIAKDLAAKRRKISAKRRRWKTGSGFYLPLNPQ